MTHEQAASILNELDIIKKAVVELPHKVVVACDEIFCRACHVALAAPAHLDVGGRPRGHSRTEHSARQRDEGDREMSNLEVQPRKLVWLSSIHGVPEPQLWFDPPAGQSWLLNRVIAEHVIPFNEYHLTLDELVQHYPAPVEPSV